MEGAVILHVAIWSAWKHAYPAKVIRIFPVGFKSICGSGIVTTVSVGAHEVSLEWVEHGLDMRVTPSSSVSQKFTLFEQSIPYRPKYNQVLITNFKYF